MPMTIRRKGMERDKAIEVLCKHTLNMSGKAVMWAMRAMAFQKLLSRIAKTYPHIFQECISREEWEEVSRKGD